MTVTTPWARVMEWKKASKAMLLIGLLAAVVHLAGGCERRDPRIEQSIERLNYSNKSPNDLRIHSKLIPALKSATGRSLQQPQLVDAAFYEARTRGIDACIEVHWISSEPIATGLEVLVGDDERFHFDFDSFYLRLNKEEAESAVVFSAAVWISEHQLDELMAKGAPTSWHIVLTRSGDPVSNVEQGSATSSPAHPRRLP